MFRFALAQLNPTIGDPLRNVDNILLAVQNSPDADLVIMPELAVTGYPPRDLLDRPSFVRDSLAALKYLVEKTSDKAVLVGAVVSATGDPLAPSGRISNGAVLAQQGRVIACHRKILLPTYDIFDEGRYFVPGDQATVIDFLGTRIGLSVCEDIWNDKDYWRDPRYPRDPIAEQVAAGAQVLINVSASPYDKHKPKERLQMLQATAKKYRTPILYCNQVGGNDSLIFDGRSLALNAQGEVTHSAPAFTEAVVTDENSATAICSWEEDVTKALILGLRDYTHKCGFKQVVLGLSGGIDSALTATLAVRALGAENVIGIAMPSRYSSQGSIDDALLLAKHLSMRCDIRPIENIFSAYLETLAEPFLGLEPDVTEENLQARIRGALLMAYSNKFGALLLTTGNKSELAVGYCTLYGDMCGGLAVISDLYKTEVYALSQLFASVIPQSTLTKAPSAELRPNQTDQDSLPPYDKLDAVLERYIDRLQSRQEIIAAGFEAGLVERIVRMVDRAEYKRRQMPPGLRISRKAFGEGRRLPIAMR
jgi:NAD+ synthase (glutamine-hydrolysing)